MLTFGLVNGLGFIREFARAPMRTGAFAASSHRLTGVMLDHAVLESASVVLELGPGNGSTTEQILKRVHPNTCFMAVEINPAFASATRRRCPQVTVHLDDALNARTHLEAAGETHCDVIFSGLPWASLGRARQDALLVVIRDLLRPGGRFITFAYLQGLLLPPAQRFQKKLRQNFTRVWTTPVVWRNLPPAFAYVAER
ncbi:MAG: class I SAM-dependent methyltransferase [Acidobacteriota bacterium]